MIHEQIWQDISQFEDALSRPTEMSEVALRHYLREQALGLFMEVSELVDSFQWKSWKPAEPIDRENFKREVVDIIFFVHHLARAHGITVAEINDKFSDVLYNNYNRHILGGEDIWAKERNEEKVEKAVEPSSKDESSTLS